MPTHPRFLRSISFIEDHLLEPVSLGDAAKQAGFSPAYYSRLFRALTGETFGAYLRGRRMTVAAERLAAEGRKLALVELAFACGYDSQEAFTRAFKRTFGRTPGAFRAAPARGHALRRRPIDAESLAHLHEVLDMEPEIREREAFTVAGLREHFAEDTRHRIPALWDRFVALVDRIPHQASDSAVGLSCAPDIEQGSFDYVAGVEVTRVDRLPRGVVAEALPRETYAVFTHHVREGALHEQLQPTYRWIFGARLPSSRFEYLGGTDFERYPPMFEPGQRGALEIWVPVHRSK
jgi:AraC family transcriptional regulator